MSEDRTEPEAAKYVRGHELAPGDTITDGTVEGVVTSIEILPTAHGDGRSATWEAADGTRGTSDFLGGDLVRLLHRGAGRPDREPGCTRGGSLPRQYMSRVIRHLDVTADRQPKLDKEAGQ
jgi:hypothetical protein